MQLPINPHPRFRRASRVLITLVVAFGLLSCSLLSRAPSRSKINAAATEKAAGADSTQIVNDTPVLPKIALPRSFRYAGLLFELQRAAITKQPPEGAIFSDQRGAYAQTIWKVSNPGTGPVSLSRGVFTLQLGGATATKAYDDYFGSQETKDLDMVFSVPAGATWDNASLSFAEEGKIPATLPLEGETLKDLYPRKLAVSGEVQLQQPALIYQVQEGAIDLDGIGQRAEAGTQYLLFKVSATCKLAYGCFVGAVSFRLLADGVPYAPKTIDPVAEAVEPDTSQTFRLAFQVPTQTKQVELQFGEADKDTAKIPVNLTTDQ